MEPLLQDIEGIDEARWRAQQELPSMPIPKQGDVEDWDESAVWHVPSDEEESDDAEDSNDAEDVAAVGPMEHTTSLERRSPSLKSPLFTPTKTTTLPHSNTAARGLQVV